MPPPPGSPPRRSDRGRCLLALVAALALALIAAALGVDLRPRDAVFAGGARSPAPRGRPGSRAAGGRVRRPRARGAAAAPPPASESPAPPPDPHAARPDPFVVPNVVHFIFGLDPTFGHIKFGLIHYLALVGTALHIRPDEIRWHYKFLPANNSYWECAAPLVTLVPEEDVTTVHGRPLKMRVQHRADIIRMQIMLNDGGMYLDSDVVPLKSWEDLRHTPLSMGLESDAGLCNAVMVGAPNTTFIRRWWAEYARFDPDAWAYHSVHLPRELQRAHPLEVAVLQERAFFAPSWMQLTPMYDRDDGFDYHDNYGVHLWTSADPNKRAHLAGLTVRGVWEGRGSFHRVARKLLADAAAAGTLCGPIREQVEAEIARAGGVQPVFPSWPPEEKKKD